MLVLAIAPSLFCRVLLGNLSSMKWCCLQLEKKFRAKHVFFQLTEAHISLPFTKLVLRFPLYRQVCDNLLAFTLVVRNGFPPLSLSRDCTAKRCSQNCCVLCDEWGLSAGIERPWCAPVPLLFCNLASQNSCCESTVCGFLPSMKSSSSAWLKLNCTKGSDAAPGWASGYPWAIATLGSLCGNLAHFAEQEKFPNKVHFRSGLSLAPVLYFLLGHN